MATRSIVVSVALTTLGAVGCGRPTGPVEALQLAAVAITSTRGTGTIGNGVPAGDGVATYAFSFAAGISGGLASGTLDYTDYAVLKPDGQYAHFVVGPSYPGTMVATFVQTSSTCVEFDGQGKLLNTGELLAFRVQACDNGAGWSDVFAIYVPERLVTHGQPYQRGPDMLSSGDIISSGPATPTVGL
jgi:hypothetical protein